ncbi:hypothetical protein QJ854_gp617 [Moumouvirus goulette]|uniref:BTB domain-containing protein n=1 Tax=Moumouvirus goulette TaxID=1247379 RepID=M1NMA4_9VIRU|nr:hypothetical protein QJ854_gp617 [Moumouvirus goulette]AGF85165.1 hypothetical protein glt_00356 [Moumouvirus goulette]
MRPQYVDKNILIKSCKYFEILFSKFLDKNSKNITINVPNCNISCDIIKYIHGEEKNIKYGSKY